MGGRRPESLAPWISLGATLPPRGFWRGLEAVLLVTVMAEVGGALLLVCNGQGVGYLTS